MDSVLKPPRLRPGDRVAVVAPAGPIVPGSLAAGLDLLRSWGLDPVEMPGLYLEHGYLAGPDAARLADLQAALADPGFAGVIAARGGYGTQRIVDRLDWDAAAPRVVVGFSDLTALHSALWARLRLVTFHGPGARWNPERTDIGSAASLRRALMEPGPIGVIAVPPGIPAPVPVAAGRAEGTLLGGNLALLTASIGTPDQPEWAGAIVLLEDVGEPLYRIDRMLTHLLRSGRLEGAAGVVFGATAVGDGDDADLADLLADRLGPLQIPVLYGLPLGHRRHQQTVPLGVRARLEADRARLEILEAATRD